MNSPSSSFSSARLLSPCMTRIFTAVWLSRLVVKILVRLVGTVVFCGISSSKFEPNVMMPSACGVTSSRITSWRSWTSAAPWMRRADRHDLVGVDALVRLAAEELGDRALHGRHARHAADEDHVLDLVHARAWRRSMAWRQMSTVRSIRSSVRLLERVARRACAGGAGPRCGRSR